MFPVTRHCLCSAIVVSSDCPISCRKTCITTPSDTIEPNLNKIHLLVFSPASYHLPLTVPSSSSRDPSAASLVRGAARIFTKMCDLLNASTHRSSKDWKMWFFLLFLFQTGGWICLPTSNFCQIHWVIFCMDLLIRSSQFLGGSRSWCDIVVM